MRRLQQIGGVAAIIFAIAVAAELALFLIAVPALGSNLNDLNDPDKYAKLLARGQAIFVAEGVLFALASAFCFALVRALQERAGRDSGGLGDTGASFGYAGYTLLLTAFSLRVFLALDTQHAVQAISGLNILNTALGAAGGLLIGIWMLLTAISAVRSATLPRPLTYFTFLSGLALVTSGVLPVPVFIPVFLIWSLWVGAVLLRQPEVAYSASQNARQAQAGLPS